MISLFLIFACSQLVQAHPGKTDSQGGHYDWDTGEYHFHHGYPAHSHEGGTCPYDFVDKTGDNSGDSSGGNSYNRQEPESFDDKPLEEHTYVRSNVTESQIADYNPQEQKENNSVTKIIVLVLFAVLLVFFVAKHFIRHHSKPEKKTKNNYPIEHPKKEDYEKIVAALRAVAIQKTANEQRRVSALQHRLRIQRQKSANAAQNYHRRKMTVQLVRVLFYDNNGSLRKHLSIEEYRINQQIANELFGFIDISVFIPDLPNTIRIGKNDDLVFLSNDKSKPYGIYTGYRKDKNHKIHLYPSCNGEIYDKTRVICILGVPQNQICARCDQKRLFHIDTCPHWYNQYKRIKEIKDFYFIKDTID